MSPEELAAHIAFEKTKVLTRRHFFGGLGMGFGSIALSALDDSVSAAPPQRTINQPSNHVASARSVGAKPKGEATFEQRTKRPAKAVIYLHMAGSPSQLELFDDKPVLRKHHGEKCPDEFLKGKRFAFIRGVPTMLGGLFTFKQHGQSGQVISELLPNIGKVADDISVIRSCNTDQFNHAPAQLYVQTGQPRLGYPSLGSWVTYGLGTESANLPGYVVLCSAGKVPDAGKSVWGSGFLPSVYQGVQCRTDGDPVLYLSNPAGMDRDLRRQTLDAMRELNAIQEKALGDPETVTRIKQYELAYQMQVSVPDAMDISKEPQHILDLYGAKPGYRNDLETMADPRTSYKADDPSFANNCLLARRLVERGVRFVQLFDWGWDHHGSSPGESLDETLPIKAKQIDKAIAGLITDLKQRGMLDDVLIVWGGEFGRTPMMQNNVNTELKKGLIGRDHHPHAFTMFMAGGGIKGGVSVGETDDLGYNITKAPVGIRDLQATIMHAAGLNPHRFSYRYQGLAQRYIGPTDEGKVLKQLLKFG